MAKVTLPRFATGISSDALNSAMEQLEAAFDNTLSRDGDTPNQMEADIDLNGRGLLNNGDVGNPNSVITYQQMTDYVASVSSGVVVQKQELQISGNLQTVFNLNSFQYSPGANNLGVYVEGVRKFAPVDFTETDEDTITFLAGQTLGAEVEFVVNEYLGSTNLPAHTHPWSQITNVPVFTTRWPDWTEVTGKPVSFVPAAHQHDTADITSGRLADARRGVHVQAGTPSASTVGELWFF